MSRPTPSKTIRQALVDYSDDRQEKSRERSRSRSRDKEKRRAERQNRPEPQRPGIKTRDQGQQPSKSKGVGLRPKSVLKEAPSVPAAQEDIPLQLSETVAPLPTASGEAINEEILDALKNSVDEPSFAPQEEIQAEESPSAVIESVLEEEKPNAEKPDTTTDLGMNKRSKSVLTKIKTWIVGKQSSIADKDRLSTVEEGPEENAPETENEVQEEGLTNTNFLTSSMGVMASIQSLVPDEEANTIISTSEKDASSIHDVAVDTEESIGTADKSELCERHHHKRRKPWFSSIPKYSMPDDMKDGDKTVQTRFIQKIFAIYLIKALAVLFITTTAFHLPEFRKLYEDPEIVHFHFISVGYYIVEKLTVRLLATKCRNLKWLHFMLTLTEIINVCHIFSFLLVAYLNEDSFRIVTNKILYVIAITSLYFIIVGFFVTFDMRDQVMMGAAAIIVALACTHQVIHNMVIGVHTEHFDQKSLWVDELCLTAATLAVSEIIILTIMWELKRILTGHRIPNITSEDWLLTSNYLI